MLCEQQITQ